MQAFDLRLRMLIDKLAGKKIIILDIEETTFVPYILPIYNSLREKTNKISYYIATHYKGDESLSPFGISMKKQFNVNLSRHLPHADIFLSPHIYGKGSRRSYKIHINHNQPVKYESYQKEDFINYDAHFLTSPLHREQTENTIKKYDLEKKNIKLYDIGYPKSDALLCGKYKREDVLTDIGLDPHLKTVVYAPSWDEGLSLRTAGEEIIERILQIENINLIVKLHPISYCPENGPNYLFYTGGINWNKILKKFETNSRFRHVPTNNIDPILSASDVMVTDVSSVALEFIMLDKPVIYIDCPEFFEKTLKKTYANFGDTTADFVRNDPKANAGRHVGKVVFDLNDLKKIVINSIEDPSENSEKRKEFAKQLSYNKGRASTVAADTIIKLLEQNGQLK